MRARSATARARSAPNSPISGAGSCVWQRGRGAECRRSRAPQVSEQAAGCDGTGDLLERTHRLLTEVDAQLDRVLLLIDHADRLSSSALRFLQLTSRSGPKLRVVLASTPSGAARPAAPEFNLLAARSVRIGVGP